MNKKEMAITALKISNIYNIEFNEDKANIWLEVLKDVDFQKASIALAEIFKTETYPPTPASIINKIAEMENTLPSYREALNILSDWVEGKIVLREIKPDELKKYAEKYGMYNMDLNWNMFMNTFKYDWRNIIEENKQNSVKAITGGNNVKSLTT